MKKNLFMVAAVALFATVSCNDQLSQELTPAGEGKVYSAIADGSDTKAVLDGKSTNWEDGDVILIYDGTSAAKHVTSLETPSAKAEFALAENETALAGNKVIAVYPEWADGYKSSVADIEAKTLSKAYLASNQTARAGSYDPNTAIAMAYSEDNTLEFKNATSLLKFTVATENVKAVTIYSIGGEKLTGEWALDYNNGAPKATPADGDASMGWVELSAGEGTFTVGTEYFIAVYPQTLASGFGLEFSFAGVSEKQTVKKYESSVEFKRNVILNLGELEFTGEITPDQPEEVVVDYWAVVGTMTDNWASEIKMTLDGDWYVATDVKLTAADEFKFRADGDSNWTINRGAEGSEDGVTIEDNVETTVVQGGKNFCVAENGMYSVYINKSATKAKVVRTGDIPLPAVKNWGVVGSITGWGSSADIAMTLTGDWYVATAVEMPAGTEFKFRTDQTWANDGGEELTYAGSITPGNEYNVSGGSSNISVATGAIYDVYLSHDETKMKIVKVGDLADPDILAKDGYVYLLPNSNWTSNNAWFAIYFFGSGEKWVKMQKVEGTSYYEAELPDGYTKYTNLIFCRMDPGKTALDWGSKWNQSGDLPISNLTTKNCCAINAGQWDCGTNVKWSKVTKLN